MENGLIKGRTENGRHVALTSLLSPLLILSISRIATFKKNHFPVSKRNIYLFLLPWVFISSLVLT